MGQWAIEAVGAAFRWPSAFRERFLMVKLRAGNVTSIAACEPAKGSFSQGQRRYSETTGSGSRILPLTSPAADRV